MRAHNLSAWRDVTQFDGNLVDSEGLIIGRLNCQFGPWTCAQAQAEVMQLAMAAKISDHTYTGDVDPRFTITTNPTDPSTPFSFSLRAKETILLNSPDYATS